MLDCIQKASDSRCDDGASMRHRLAGDDAVALPPGRADDDRSAVVVVAELLRRHEADGIGNEVSQRAVADDDAGDASSRVDELLDAFLRRQPADVEHVGRLVRLCQRLGQLHATADHPDVGRTQASDGLGEGQGRRDDHARAPNERAEERGRTGGELDVGSPGLENERLPRDERREARGQPVRVDYVGAPGGMPRCARERGEERRQERRPGGLRPEVRRDAVAVRDAEVPEAGGRDHPHVDARRAQVLDGVADECAGDVAFVPRIGRGKHRDPHGESQYARMDRRLPGWLLPAAGIGLPLLAVLVAILVLEPYYGVVDDAILLGYAQVAAADFPGEWADRVWSDISAWGMVRPFYWALAYAEYSAGAESPTALYVVNWAATGAVLAFAGFAIARAFRVERSRLGIFLAVYGAAVFVYPWTLDLFAFPSYQEKWVVLAAALGLLWFAEPRERLPAWQWYAVSALVIGLGATTKAQFVVFLPAFCLLVLDHRREGRASWWRVAAVTAMGAVSGPRPARRRLARRLHGGFRPLERARPARLQVPLARGGFRPRMDGLRGRAARQPAPRPHPDGCLRRLRLRLRAVAGRLPLDPPRVCRRRRLRARGLAPSLGRPRDGRARGEPRLGLHVDRRADGRALLVADKHRRVRPLGARPRARGRRHTRLHLVRGRLLGDRRLRAA